ncbi:S-layer homology domain-containing protein, partial [Clostridium perfringens]
MKKQFIKIAGIALASTLMVGLMCIKTPNAQAATTQFSDVKSTHWGD